MSVETIAVVISAAWLLVSFFAGFGWIIRRSDAQFERMRVELGARIDGVARDLDGVARDLGTRIDRVEHEVVEVKIAVARIEGPPRRLLTAP